MAVGTIGFAGLLTDGNFADPIRGRAAKRNGFRPHRAEYKKRLTIDGGEVDSTNQFKTPEFRAMSGQVLLGEYAFPISQCCPDKRHLSRSHNGKRGRRRP